jgi:ribosomal protein L30
MKQYLKITLVRSGIGCTKRQKETIKGLGLTRPNRSAVVEDTQPVRGMIHKIRHMVRIDEEGIGK